jgi:hypothetical protein
MSEVLELTTTEPTLPTAAIRALIESELRKDVGRSDREIARIVGVDHKTVGKVRGTMTISIVPIASPPAAKPEPEENHFLPECEDLVLPSQPATAIYENRYSQVVIRQEADWSDDGDHFVYICPKHLGVLIARLQQYLP